MRRKAQKFIGDDGAAAILVIGDYRRTAVPPYRLKPSSK